jgi:peptide deformylase
MKLVTIDQTAHQVLRDSAKRVEFPLSAAIKQFIDEFVIFIKTLESPYGKPAGLAATQVGVSLQIFLLQIPEEAKKVRKDVFDILPLSVWINPSYVPIEVEGKTLDWEGCYSVPEKMGEVYRYKAVEYQAQTLTGEKISGVARGLLARIIQHETGHLNGELFCDLITKGCRFGLMEEMWKIRRREMQL